MIEGTHCHKAFEQYLEKLGMNLNYHIIKSQHHKTKLMFKDPDGLVAKLAHAFCEGWKASDENFSRAME